MSGARPRKVCVITGSRAEYGILYWLMREIVDDPALELQFIVTGTHLASGFGDTLAAIVDDGFRIDAKVDIHPDDDTPAGVSRSLGLCVGGMADAFARLRPDIVIVQGDRYEMLGAAAAAVIARIPIAHIHGGELTEGAIDDAFRHAITKMAHYHFVSAEPYRARVIQLGEQPERVFTVGAPGIDNIGNLDLLHLDALARDLGIALDGPYFLVTYHPVTLSGTDPAQAIGELLAALDEFPDCPAIITGVNADPGHDAIARAIAAYAAENPARVSYHASLGQLRYLSAMKHAACVLGNSSSGIVEAPAMKVPTVNVGARQRGRVRAASVIDCDETRGGIAAALAQALSPAFREALPATDSPYGHGGASKRIKDLLATLTLDGIAMKTFHDLPGTA